MWRQSDPCRTTDEIAPLRLQAVREFAELNPRGVVVTSGGEPLVEPGHYFNTCRVARESGIESISVMNGTLTETREQAEDLLTRGADLLALSLDDSREEVHDQMRGRRGAWRKTTRTLRMLVEARERLGLPRRIHAMLMVCDYNYQRIDEAYDLVLRQIGADKLKLNFLLPTLSRFSERDAFWDLHSRNINVETLMRKIEECEKEYDLDYNPRWKENLRDYAEALARHHQGGPLQTTKRLCDSPERNLVIEFGGAMRLCPFPKFPYTPYRGRGDLARYWYSPETEAVRAEMRECRDVCGMCHAYRREPSSRASAERKLGRLEPRDVPVTTGSHPAPPSGP